MFHHFPHAIALVHTIVPNNSGSRDGGIGWVKLKPFVVLAASEVVRSWLHLIGQISIKTIFSSSQNRHRTSCAIGNYNAGGRWSNKLKSSLRMASKMFFLSATLVLSQRRAVKKLTLS